MNFLDINNGVVFDHSISDLQEHTHMPYAGSSLGPSDEIRIPIQHQDKYILPSQSSIHIKGKLLNAAGTGAATNAHLTNNGLAFLFDEIRYELNGVEIARTKNVGITSTMKGYVSYGKKDLALLENAGWNSIDSDSDPPVVNSKEFYAIIPLNSLLGFAEDYKKIIVNSKHELVLLRARSDKMALISTNADSNNSSITIDKIYWKVPYVTVSDNERLQILNLLDKNVSIPMSFRVWELYEYPLLSATTKHTWCVKTSSQLEKPRYIILGFQTNRKLITSNSSLFDHCNITNVKLHLNSVVYPYDNMDINFTKNNYSELFNMFLNFQSSYYNLDKQQTLEPMFSRNTFKSQAPLIVLDCSRQADSIKSGSPVDIRIEIETSENIPANTALYCLILHDRIATYRPFTGEVLIQQ